jgi:hypothetical protein
VKPVTRACCINIAKDATSTLFKWIQPSVLSNMAGTGHTGLSIRNISPTYRHVIYHETISFAAHELRALFHFAIDTEFYRVASALSPFAIKDARTCHQWEDNVTQKTVWFASLTKSSMRFLEHRWSQGECHVVTMVNTDGIGVESNSHMCIQKDVASWKYMALIIKPHDDNNDDDSSVDIYITSLLHKSLQAPAEPFLQTIVASIQNQLRIRRFESFQETAALITKDAPLASFGHHGSLKGTRHHDSSLSSSFVDTFKASWRKTCSSKCKKTRACMLCKLLFCPKHVDDGWYMNDHDARSERGHLSLTWCHRQ